MALIRSTLGDLPSKGSYIAKTPVETYFPDLVSSKLSTFTTDEIVFLQNSLTKYGVRYIEATTTN